MKLVVKPECLKELRIERAWTQGRLGDEAGVNEKTVRLAEGGTPVSLTTISKLASALGVAVSDIAMKSEVTAASRV